MSLIKPNTEYTSYDTSSAATAVTLTATPGKSYEVWNSGSGGYALTVTYGTSSYIFNDEEGGTLTYDGTNWATQFSTVGGGVALISGRIAYTELRTVFDSAVTGWVTVAQVDSGIALESTTGQLVVMDGVGNSLQCDYAMSPSSYTRSFDGTTITSSKPAGYSDSSNKIKNFRFAKSDSDSSAGYKIQVYCNGVNAIVVQLRGNMSRLTTMEGMELIEAVLEDTPLLPDGSEATYLEAGTELKVLSTSSTTIDQRIGAYAHSTTSLRVSVIFNVMPKVNATVMTFPVGFTFRQSDGTAIYTVTAGDTATIERKTDNTVLATITTTGLTASVSGFAVGINITVELT